MKRMFNSNELNIITATKSSEIISLDYFTCVEFSSVQPWEKNLLERAYLFKHGKV